MLPTVSLLPDYVKTGLQLPKRLCACCLSTGGIGIQGLHEVDEKMPFCLPCYKTENIFFPLVRCESCPHFKNVVQLTPAEMGTLEANERAGRTVESVGV